MAQRAASASIAVTQTPVAASGAMRARMQPYSARQVACRIAMSEDLQARSRLLTEPQHKYLLGELLGSGTAARVVVGTDVATQAQYAVKILPKLRGAKNRTEQIQQEVSARQGCIKIHYVCCVLSTTHFPFWGRRKRRVCGVVGPGGLVLFVDKTRSFACSGYRHYHPGTQSWE